MAQQMLFDNEERSRNARLDEMQDQLKDRFGHDAIRRGTSVEHDISRRPDPRVNDLNQRKN